MKADTVNVLHGNRVEFSDEWIFEGTWAGEFGKADFDRDAPVIFGSGVRLRNNTVTFVCSTNQLDRLFYVSRKKESFVSNSLACLLSVSNLCLNPNFPYAKTLALYINNHRHHPRTIPTMEGDEIHVLIYDRLVYSQGALEQQNPQVEENFTSFEDYEHFLSARISALHQNLQDEHRQFNMIPIATISKGYDSAASVAIAKPLGIQSALTISHIGTFSQHNDSGQEIADHLGIPVKSVSRKPSAYRDYDLVWAGLGQFFDLNMTLFDYPDDLNLLVVGTHGDIVWQKGLKRPSNDSRHFLDRGDTSGCGLNEWRLHKGICFAGIPCLGASRLDSLARINDSPAMDPWRIGGGYDRPIPRRILEQRGVLRSSFGIKKMATVQGYRMFYPNDPSQLNDLAIFLEKNNRILPTKLGLLLHLPRVKLFEFAHRKKFYNIAHFFELPDYDDLFFVWANNRLANNNYRIPP